MNADQTLKLVLGINTKRTVTGYSESGADVIRMQASMNSQKFKRTRTLEYLRSRMQGPAVLTTIGHQWWASGGRKKIHKL